MITFDSIPGDNVRIRVIGIGGGGCNTVDFMAFNNLTGVDIVAANTDKQALGKSIAPIKIQIGKQTTNGRGAGSIPDIGKKSAEENIEEIKEVLKGSEMIFVTAGMGGGTGTGASPVIARIGQELGALVVAIVTKPFNREGPRKMEYAELGIDELRQFVDAYIIIPNQKLVDINEPGLTLKNAFARINNVLYNATCGIADIITKEGYMNVDFADVKTIMKSTGQAIMGIGRSSGENRAILATQDALNSPLLEGVAIKGAKNALVNITTSEDLFTFTEYDDVLKTLQEAAGESCNIKTGVVYADEYTEEISVTVVATGFAKDIERMDSGTAKKLHGKDMELFTKTLKPQNFKTHIPNTEQYNFSDAESEQRVISGSNGIMTPHGNQLKKYDDPAFKRRPPVESPPIDNDDENSKIRYIGSTKMHNINELESKDNLSQPAFLRKILD